MISTGSLERHIRFSDQRVWRVAFKSLGAVLTMQLNTFPTHCSPGPVFFLPQFSAIGIGGKEAPS